MAGVDYKRMPDETPTLADYPGFDAEMDAEALRGAMKGVGTDEKAISAIFGRRSVRQRVEIVHKFKSCFGKDLEEELSSELSGKYKKMLKNLCLTPTQYDVEELKRAMKGAGTDEDALIEILCTRSNQEIKDIVVEYNKKYGQTLEAAIQSETSGHLKRLFVSLLQALRDESNEVDEEKVADDVLKLHEAGAEKWGTDESKFNQILVNRSYANLRAIFYCYEEEFGRNMEDIISSEFSGDIKKALLTIVKCTKNKPRYFAEALYKSMKGLGTDDDTLLRLVITRCEVDMGEIKKEFETAYETSLAEMIKGDTSGDYQEMLLLLINEPNE